MMTPAYDEIFLDDAMNTLGEAVEYAVIGCKIPGQEFFDMFSLSKPAIELGKGNPLFVSGMSGVDIVNNILRKKEPQVHDTNKLPYIDYPPEYWIGWILAYFQWKTGMTFSNILKVLKYEMLANMYGVLHEADPEKSYDTFMKMFDANKNETSLARIRKMRNFSQSELAELSGVSIRTIQLFEQRRSNINNAQYNNLKAIADVLKCQIEDLLEEMSPKFSHL